MKEFEHQRIVSTRHRGKQTAHHIRFSKRAAFGLALLVLLLGLALLAPFLAPINANDSMLTVHLDLANIQPGNTPHWLGTDYLGRDVFSQVIWGSRASLLVGLMAAMIAVTFGSLWGSLSAFAGGWIDAVMMRIVDGLLSIPSIILLLCFNTLLSTPGLVMAMPSFVLKTLQVSSFSYGLLPLITVVIVISSTTWLEAARISRAKIKTVKSEEYIEAAQSLGVSTMRMLSRHLLPNAASVLLIEATLLVSDAVLMESGLSYLGLGLGPSTPSWGSMLSSAQISLSQGNWWAVFIPGILITLTVLCVNLIGEGWLELFSVRLPTA